MSRVIFRAAVTLIAILPSAPAQKLIGTGAVGNAAQGTAVALSADGNTAIVGGPADNGGAGAVWIFTLTNGVWTQQGNKIVGTGAVGNAGQGAAVAISADGNTALIGGPGDAGNLGAAWVFTLLSGVWTQQGAKLVGAGAVPTDGKVSQGCSVALSADGNTALVGGRKDNSTAGGAAWVFTRSNSVWSPQGAKLVGSGAVRGNVFYGPTNLGVDQGASVALSADGNTAVVGGPFDSYVSGGDAYTSGGAVWVFTRSSGFWSQQGAKLAAGRDLFSYEGASVAVSSDGNTFTAVGDDPFGSVWVFTRNNGVWSQQGSNLMVSGAGRGLYVEASSTALSSDGNTALIGGSGDNQSVGAAWVFTRSNGVWTQQGGKLIAAGAIGQSQQGASVSLSADGKTALIGGPGDNGGAGATWVLTPGATVGPPAPTGVSPPAGIHPARRWLSPSPDIRTSLWRTS